MNLLNVAPLERINILPCAKQERLQSNIKGTMQVSTWLSRHLCIAQRLVELALCGHFVVIKTRDKCHQFPTTYPPVEFATQKGHLMPVDSLL